MNIWDKLSRDEQKEIQRIYKSNQCDTNNVGTVMELIFGKDNFTVKPYGQAELFAEHPELKEQYDMLCDVSYTMGAGRKICCYWLLSFIREYGYEAYNPNDIHCVLDMDEHCNVYISMHRSFDLCDRGYREPVLAFTDRDEAKRFLESNRELIKNYLDTKHV